MSEGEVRGTENVSRLAHFLVKKDPQRAARLSVKGPWRFHSIEEVYAFRNPIISEAVKAGEGEFVLAQLQTMRRGGAQQDMSGYFRDRWAETYPAKAVEHFDKLVALKANPEDGSRNRESKKLANKLMHSWLAKDPKGAEIYLENEPESPSRTVLEKALEAQKSWYARNEQEG